MKDGVPQPTIFVRRMGGISRARENHDKEFNEHQQKTRPLYLIKSAGKRIKDRIEAEYALHNKYRPGGSGSRAAKSHFQEMQQVRPKLHSAIDKEARRTKIKQGQAFGKKLRGKEKKD
jgi:hypothetical protein